VPGSPGSKTRRHHHVPVFYLSGFTDVSTRDGRLWAHDLDRAKQYHTGPANVAHRRDFYSLDDETAGSDALESMFAENESRSAPAIKRVVESLAFPSGEDLDAILEFVTLLAFRTPAVREMLMDFTARVARMITNVMTSSEEAWAATVEGMRASGTDVPDDASYEAIRRVAQDCEIKVADNDYIKGLSLTAVPEILALMHQRGWSLFVAPEDGPTFITSDHPVALVWSDGHVGGFYPPGFGLEGTRVIVALSARVALVGEFGLPTGSVVHVGAPVVASINSALLLRARTIFCRERDFVWGYANEIRKGMQALLEIRKSPSSDSVGGSAAPA
jgi:hypothetical protein